MKKLFIAAAFVLAATSISISAQERVTETNNCAQQSECCGNAQCRKAPKHKHHRHQRADLFNGIELTQEQQTAITALRQDRTARQNRTEADRPTAEQRREAMKQQREKFVNGVKEILTPEQFQVFEQNLQAARNNHRHERGNMNHKTRRGNNQRSTNTNS